MELETKTAVPDAVKAQGLFLLPEPLPWHLPPSMRASSKCEHAVIVANLKQKLLIWPQDRFLFGKKFWVILYGF